MAAPVGPSTHMNLRAVSTGVQLLHQVLSSELRDLRNTSRSPSCLQSPTRVAFFFFLICQRGLGRALLRLQHRPRLPPPDIRRTANRTRVAVLGGTHASRAHARTGVQVRATIVTLLLRTVSAAARSPHSGSLRRPPVARRSGRSQDLCESWMVRWPIATGSNHGRHVFGDSMSYRGSDPAAPRRRRWSPMSTSTKCTSPRRGVRRIASGHPPQRLRGAHQRLPTALSESQTPRHPAGHCPRPYPQTGVERSKSVNTVSGATYDFPRKSKPVAPPTNFSDVSVPRVKRTRVVPSAGVLERH